MTIIFPNHRAASQKVSEIIELIMKCNVGIEKKNYSPSCQKLKQGRIRIK